MKYSRNEVVRVISSWLGKNERDGSFKYIIDLYNSYKGPLPRGIKMNYKMSWCACTVSAVAIQLGYTSIIPIEISCGYMIDGAKKKGIWVESDRRTPEKGDIVMYDWGDDGKGDNTGWPDHVGIVTYVNEKSGYFEVIEGNYKDSVKKRTVSINGRYIRGFIVPKYDEDDEEPKNQEGSPSVSKPKKTIDEIAHEVILGKWGSGIERQKRLKEKGYDYNKIQDRVNKILNGSAKVVVKDSNIKQSVSGTIESTCYAKSFDSKLAGEYKTTANLYLRNDAGTNKKALCKIPKGTTVHTYGFYTVSRNVKWLYITAKLDGVQYIGFSSSEYLSKIK